MSVAPIAPDRSDRARRRPGTRGHVRRRRRPRLVPWSQLHDDARAVAAGLQARGIDPGRPRGDPRADQPAARHRDPGVLAGRRDRRRAAAADADGVDRGVRRPDPLPDPQRRRCAAADRPRARAVHRAGRRAIRRRCCCPICMPGRGRPSPDELDAVRRRPRSTGDPAVHERLDLRAEGRDAARSASSCANLDAIEQGHGARRRRRRPRLVAAAVPRHGPGRAA